MFGNALRYEHRERDYIFRRVCSNVNIGDLQLFFELFLWDIDVHELVFQAEYFPSKSGQSVSEDSLPEKCLVICYTIIHLCTTCYRM